MKISGCIDVSGEKVHHSVRHLENDPTFDIIFHMYEKGGVTITVNEDQIIRLQELLTEVVKVHTDHELPYHV